VKLPHGKIPQLRRKVGVIFQDLKLLMDRTVLENVMLPLEFIGTSSADARHRAMDALVDIGLAGKGDQFPLQWSGGERQRVAIARTLVFNPEIIIADEPTGNLDLQTSLQILDLLEKINARGTTVFMATHNEEIIRKTEKRVIFLEKGKLIQDRAGKELKPAPTTVQTEDKKKSESLEKKEEIEKKESGKKEEKPHLNSRDKVTLDEISEKK